MNDSFIPNSQIGTTINLTSYNRWQPLSLKSIHPQWYNLIVKSYLYVRYSRREQQSKVLDIELIHRDLCLFNRELEFLSSLLSTWKQYYPFNKFISSNKHLIFRNHSRSSVHKRNRIYPNWVQSKLYLHCEWQLAIEQYRNLSDPNWEHITCPCWHVWRSLPFYCWPLLVRHKLWTGELCIGHYIPVCP